MAGSNLTILGGRWSGRRLKAPDRKDLRPTLGRVKAAIFSILESIVWKRQGQPDFSGWRCLDLFAGVGGLGLEILSRGADHCVFVEKNRLHAKALQENVSSLQCQGQATVLLDDVAERAWEKFGPYDLVLLDPPYAQSDLPELIESLGGVLKPGGIVIFEHDPNVQMVEISGFSLHSSRKLGPAGISVYCARP